MEQKTLQNNIPVLFSKMDGSKRFALFLTINKGAAAETDTEHGLAHLCEHILFKSNGMFTTHELVQQMEWHGIEINASTSYSSVKIYCSGPAKQIVKAIDLLYKMVEGSEYSNEEFLKERDVVHEELRAYRNDPPSYVADWIVDPLLFANTPQGHKIIGEESQLTKYTLQDVKTWKKKTFVAQNMILSVSGSFDKPKTLESLQNSFGKLPGQEKFSSYNPPTSPCRSTTKKESRPGIDQAYVRQSMFVPAKNTDSYLPMLVLSYVVDGGMSSLAFQELREKRALGYGVGYNYSEDYGYASFYVNGCDPKKTQECVEAFEDVLIQVQNIKEEEFEGMKTLLIAHTLQEMQDEEDVAEDAADSYVFASNALYDKTIDQVDNITLEQVKSLAKTIQNSPKITGILLPSHE